MVRPSLSPETRQITYRRPGSCPAIGFGHLAAWCAAGLLLPACGMAQVITVDTHTGKVTSSSGNTTTTVDRRYQQVEPTHVALPTAALDAKTRLELVRLLQAEQGFAMRPFPRGHKGLTLEANGKLEPAGEAYLSMATAQGISARPGDRVVLSDLKIDATKIVIDLNGGPDPKHRFLRHVEVGTNPDWTSPVVQQDGKEATGARLTLAFPGHIPELTAAQVKALLAPLISFDVKTPIQAYTDTLPTRLKEAILNHHVMVGMSTEMVLYAKGQPEKKIREMDGQMPFEEWIYGTPPQEVDFVRINGNRVIRLEVAKMGESPVILTKDEVSGMMRTDGSPLDAALSTTRTVEMGDAQRNPDTQAPAAPPTLRNPGETLPDDRNKNVGTMKPVRFPKQTQESQPGSSPEDQPEASGGSSSSAPADATQANPPSPPPASGQQPD